jgi:hypothetical protein
MESINENVEMSKMKCSSCNVSRDIQWFGDNGRNGCFKTCSKCRASKKKSREKRKENSRGSSTTRDHWMFDGWKNMTAELLEPMTYAEKCAIHICGSTVVSRLNIEYMCEKIHLYCGPDPSIPNEETGDTDVGTVLSEESIDVYMKDRGGDFKVKLGDTWAEIRENIHCC